MDLNKYNEQIESSGLYKFLVRHKKVINIIEGLFIIGLLVGMDIYVIQDHNLKTQIKERCGYTTSTYQCVCEKNFVDDWEEFQKWQYNPNITNYKNFSLVE